MSFYHPHPINRAWRLHTCCYVSLWSVWWPHTIISLMSGVSTDHLKCFQKNILLSVRFIYYFPSGRSSNYLKFFLHQTLSLFLSLSLSPSLSLSLSPSLFFNKLLIIKLSENLLIKIWISFRAEDCCCWCVRYSRQTFYRMKEAKLTQLKMFWTKQFREDEILN